ncbi:MAG: hypothetical protein CMB82_05190 [Flammeovirgaceae bacterium]|nr:hypothetical protein [Flammeovirgaceae bacterium]
MENIVMFSIGLIIFILYMVGYLIMVKKANEMQEKKIKNDPELTASYRKVDSIDMDGMGNYGRFPKGKLGKKK